MNSQVHCSLWKALYKKFTSKLCHIHSSRNIFCTKIVWLPVRSEGLIPVPARKRSGYSNSHRSLYFLRRSSMDQSALLSCTVQCWWTWCLPWQSGCRPAWGSRPWGCPGTLSPRPGDVGNHVYGLSAANTDAETAQASAAIEGQCLLWKNSKFKLILVPILLSSVDHKFSLSLEWADLPSITILDNFIFWPSVVTVSIPRLPLTFLFCLGFGLGLVFGFNLHFPDYFFLIFVGLL